jgi:hypothetical protein
VSGTQATTYTQQFDLENRLTAVSVTQASGSPQVTRFAYDGDGEGYREDAPGGGVTLYVSELQELQVAGGQVLTRTSYYYHGGVRVGMRVAGVGYYLHADHLGSVTLTTDEDGDVVARRLYRPYGAARYVTGTVATG